MARPLKLPAGEKTAGEKRDAPLHPLHPLHLLHLLPLSGRSCARYTSVTSVTSVTSSGSPCARAVAPTQHADGRTRSRSRSLPLSGAARRRPRARCGFDILRSNGGSYICDVNGWASVKDSPKFWDDAANLLRQYVLGHPLPPPTAQWGRGSTGRGHLACGRALWWEAYLTPYHPTHPPCCMWQASEAFCGKLRCNSKGTEFAIYDDSNDPYGLKTGKPRRELGIISYAILHPTSYILHLTSYELASVREVAEL